MEHWLLKIAPSKQKWGGIYTPKDTLAETNNQSTWKMDGWNTFSFPFGKVTIFGGDFATSSWGV